MLPLFRRTRWVQWGQMLAVSVCLLGGTLTCMVPRTGGILIVYARPKIKPYSFPDGGRTLFPGYRLVALYGAPDIPELGALGQQSLTDSVGRVRALAAQYQPLVAEHTLPTFEIITTIASSSPGPTGSYSYAIDNSTLESWVAAARQSGIYVVLDLQPGRESFLTQAQRLSPLLLQPNVGLALDPEWRLGPTQLPLAQIGSVGIDEVNQTAEWLASLTRAYKLPQKLFLLHEFRPSMIASRDQLDVSHPELAYAVQMDGQGAQSAKLSTWQSITADPPANTRFGWKNFYAKDSPLRSPEETMQIAPQPWYVSYQ